MHKFDTDEEIAAHHKECLTCATHNFVRTWIEKNGGTNFDKRDLYFSVISLLTGIIYEDIRNDKKNPLANAHYSFIDVFVIGSIVQSVSNFLETIRRDAEAENAFSKAKDEVEGILAMLEGKGKRKQ